MTNSEEKRKGLDPWKWKKGKDNSTNKAVQVARDKALAASIGAYPLLDLPLIKILHPDEHPRKVEQRCHALAKRKAVNRYATLDGRLVYTTQKFDGQVSPQYDHKLLSSTFWVSWDLATRGTAIQTTLRQYEHHLRGSDFPGGIPDNVCGVHHTTAESWVIEADMGSESLQGERERTYLFDKLLRHYRHRRDIRAWLGDTPFRILVITNGERRVKNILHMLASFEEERKNPLRSGAFLICDASQIDPRNPETILSPIWRSPRDSEFHKLIH